MRIVRALTLALLIAISIASCGIPGTAAPTVAPIIIIASPTPGPTQAATEAAAPAPTQASTPAAAPTTAATAPTPAEPAPTAAPAPSALQLRFSRATLVGVFRGEIKTWNDAHIQADNPGATLPDLPIRVIYRSDPSGSTRAITEYFV
jgi:phosphate transport system substrate-binding protein